MRKCLWIQQALPQPIPKLLTLSQPWSSVVLHHTLHHVTIHILLLCSMFHDNKVRRTAEVRLNSCFLGWKFQALRAICLYVHWCIWEPSIRLLALQLLGPSQPSLPPVRLPAWLLAWLASSSLNPNTMRAPSSLCVTQNGLIWLSPGLSLC